MLNLLGGLLGGGKDGALATISKVVDELHTSEEEKLDKKIFSYEEAEEMWNGNHVCLD